MYVAILLLLSYITFITTLEIKCGLSKSNLTIDLISSEKISKIDTFFKENVENDIWSKNPKCSSNVTNKQVICNTTALQHFPKVLKINTDNEEEKIWLFNCVKTHGIRVVRVTQNNSTFSFSINWFHEEFDKYFINKDSINVTNKNTSRVSLLKPNPSQRDSFSYEFKDVTSRHLYEICVTTTFFRPFEVSGEKFTDVVKGQCTEVMSVSFIIPENKNDSDSLRTPLVAVGIGILLLLLLFFAFLLYHKKCKQGGDHDYDMNKKNEEEALDENAVEMNDGTGEKKVENENLLPADGNGTNA